MSEYFISPIDPRDRRAQAEMDELLRQEGNRVMREALTAA